MLKDLITQWVSKCRQNNKRVFFISAFLIILSLFSLFFISNNEAFYNKTIAKITSVTETESEQTTDNGKKELMRNQDIEAVVMNGLYKGKNIELKNSTSFSNVNDLNLKTGDEVFVSLEADANQEITHAKVLDLKRDKYLIYIANIFVILMLIIGGFKGFRSLASVVVNMGILFVLIELFSKGFNLIPLSIIASLFFVISSILIVSGKNRKSISAIAGTLLGTIISMSIAAIVINLNNWSGIHFEEMEFLTHPPETIFFIELMIGTLGGIMDIAISISSAIEELYDKNPNIEKIAIIKSVREIGQDIMGTMANTLVFAYLSGSIPKVLLLMRNGMPITYIININLSLEFMRALIGSIGIVLSIPITIFTSIVILKKHRMGETINL
jgi:uncharacterized membrane protein